MNHKRAITAIGCAQLIGAAVVVAFWIAIAIVIWHFIAKFW